MGFFFFQAEDGIRDLTVTGVQTCALPICATGGTLFAAGRAGDRFAVRNSGAVAVIEGAGNHCCEYMTGGTVVVLGEVGRNFGAGMSNGVAYVLDETDSLAARLNGDMVAIRPLEPQDEVQLLTLVERHLARTLSPRARDLLAAWHRALPAFRKVAPLPPPASAPVPAIAADQEPAEQVS